ncbi:uncharacterized protein LOC135696738 isoform X2 [Rhopilema esculentum]|uniref:uncharacterized protein LOC135696738 isoform X2 n=1 Tax=Rhopilema esculentum TaxID=499914 RepID=UPI0031E2D34E
MLPPNHHNWLSYLIIGGVALFAAIVSFCLWACLKNGGKEKKTKLRRTPRSKNNKKLGRYKKLSETETDLSSIKEAESLGNREIFTREKEMARDKPKKYGASKRRFSKKSMLGKCTSPRTTSPEESDNSNDTASYKTKSEKALGFPKEKGGKQSKKFREVDENVEGESRKPSLGCKDEAQKTVYGNFTTQPKGGTKKRPDKELYKPPKARAMNPRKDVRENESRTMDIPVTDLNMFSELTKEKPVENFPYESHQYKPAYRDRDVNRNEESLNIDEHNDILPNYENNEHGRTMAIKMRNGSVENLEAATKSYLVSDHSFNRSATVEYYGRTKDGNTSLDVNMRQDGSLDLLKSNQKVYEPNTDPQTLEKDKLVILYEKAHSSKLKHQHQQRLEETNLNRVFNKSSVKKLKNVGPAIFITEHATREWKGETVKADKIRRGYARVQDETGLECIRVIRGDNYCALRAVLFQSLSSGIDILANFRHLESFKELPVLLATENFDWIENWNFAGRMNLEGSSAVEILEECLDFLDKIVKKSMSCYQDTERCEMILQMMNSSEEEEIKMFEAVKFLMLFKSMEYFNMMQNDEDVNILPFLLFARDTSTNPELFMANHLNHVGDSCGLDQLEMILLGRTLNIMIRVMRLHRIDDGDFTATFPDDLADASDVVTVVAEDDRHYNALSEVP